MKDHTEDGLLHVHLVPPLGEEIPEDPRKPQLLPEPSEDQGRTEVPGPPGLKGVGLKLDPLLMAPAGQTLYELIYLALLELLEPSQVGDDALPDLSSLPYVFDDVKVGPPGAVLVFVGLGPDKHSTCMIPQSFPFVKTKNIKRSTTHWTRLRTKAAWLSHFCPSTAGFRARKCQSRVIA